MNRFKHITSIVLALATSVLMSSVAYAYDGGIPEDADPYSIEYQFDERGNFIHTGGINQFSGVKFEDTNESLERLEQLLRQYDYVCIYGTHQQISDEEYDKYFMDLDVVFSLGFEDYAPKNTNTPYEVFYQQFVNIWLYRPSYEDYKASLDASGSVAGWTLNEIRESTVIVHYGVPYSLSKVGKVLDEVNDRIPVWYDTGYLQITSPKDVKILTYHGQESAYYEFYVKANEPYLVKLKSGGYKISEVNGKAIADQEEFLPFKNNVEIVPNTCTEFEPYKLELEELLANRDIPSIDLEKTIEEDNIEREKAYENLYEEVEKEKTRLGYEDKDTKKKRWSWRIAGLLVLIMFVAIVVAVKNRVDDNEE